MEVTASKSCGFINIFWSECVSSFIFMNGDTLEAWPVNCLSNFSLFNTLFALSTVSHKLFIGNNIQYNLLGNVFLNNSKTSGSP